MSTRSRNQPKLYKDLAWTWPIISPPEDYANEAKELIEQIKTFSQIDTKTLLDLGSGGGHNDFHLKRRFTVTGVDLNLSMIDLAKNLNPEINYYQGDMRTIKLEKSYDAVMVTDSIDYMVTEKDLRATFQNAFLHLNRGGVFCTYAEEIRENFQQNKTITNSFTQNEFTITTIENSYDPDPNDTTFEFTMVFLIRKNGKLHIEQDHHIMGLFDRATWINLLEDVGFSINLIEYEETGPMFVCLKPL